MSPPRRRSARLASSTRNSSKVTPDLTSVVEVEEAAPTHIQTPSRRIKRVPENVTTPKVAPKTPVSSAVKPPHEEMHPSHAHNTMAAPNSALGLGFTDISIAKETGPAGTPSKIPQSAFSFRVNQSVGGVKLSEGAQRMMDEIREQASKIKADLVAKRLAEDEAERTERKIAQPKPKASRFSAAHIAEFKKMDSIEGHASLWRYEKAPPLSEGLKRSPSKANLDETPNSANASLKRSPSKVHFDDAALITRPGLKRSSSRANLDDKPEPSAKKLNAPTSLTKPTASSSGNLTSFSKRLKQRQDDDASTTRQVPLNDTVRPSASAQKFGLSRSQSALSRLTSPTKASQRRAVRQPTVSVTSSPTKPAAGGLPKSATTSNLATPFKATELRRHIISPGRFQKVKSILRGQSSQTSQDRPAIPRPPLLTSQTPAPPRTNKELPALPLTTPRRNLVKHVAFSPETRAAADQGSPSPQKMVLAKEFGSVKAIQYPALDSVLAQSTSQALQASSDVTYPDLSALQALTDVSPGERAALPDSKPGTFSFRSDRTIKFEDASSSFGASPGQSSIRQVRGSLIPTKMAGSFPDVASLSGSHPNKENTAPTPTKLIIGAPHGMTNKKRHRPSSDEDDAEREAARRAVKKRRDQEVPEGEALLAPRLISATVKSPIKSAKRTPGRPISHSPGSMTPSRKPGISLSRLNALARPKGRA